MESIHEILDKKASVLDQAKRADMDQADRRVSSDTVARKIRYWLKLYHNRKTSHHYEIVLRCIMRGIDVRNWVYYLELWKNGELMILRGKDYKVEYREMANAEFFDSCERNPQWVKVELGNVCLLKYKHTQSEAVQEYILEKKRNKNT